jgi:hypothetical protein
MACHGKIRRKKHGGFVCLLTFSASSHIWQFSGVKLLDPTTCGEYSYRS